MDSIPPPPAEHPGHPGDPDGEPTVIRQRGQSPSTPPGSSAGTEDSERRRDALIGHSLDHFTMLELVGGGGMGTVYRARDERLDRVVAVKVIPTAGQDPEMLRRFKIEAISAAKLDHPHIARVHYVGEAERWSYIVFEYVDGINLRDLVAAKGPLSLDEAVWFTRQVAEALAHAATRFVVHRDIKPSNLLVTKKGVVKLVDMGLARTTMLERKSSELTASNVTLGTFDYISPEQARDPRTADVRSDLYSLGCTLYYLLSGRPPFPEGTALQKLMMHENRLPEDIRVHRVDVPDELAAILSRMMAKRPIDRYQDPLQLINDLYLLAEFENLLKSRQAGTVQITPTIEEKTIFESLLPWLVFAASLFGVMLWLQSQHSTQITLPRERTNFAIQQSALPRSEADASGTAAALRTVSNAVGPTAAAVSPETFTANAADSGVSASRVPAVHSGGEAPTSPVVSAVTSLPNERGPGGSTAARTVIPSPSEPAAASAGASDVNARAAPAVASSGGSDSIPATPDRYQIGAAVSSSVSAAVPASANATVDIAAVSSSLPAERPRVSASGSSPPEARDSGGMTLPSSQDILVTKDASMAAAFAGRSVEGLAEAVELAAATEPPPIIYVAGTQRITQPIAFTRPIRLSSLPRSRSHLIIDLTIDPMMVWDTAAQTKILGGLNIGSGASVSLESIDLQLLSPESASGRLAVATLLPGARMEMRDCTATLMPSIADWTSSLLLVSARPAAVNSDAGDEETVAGSYPLLDAVGIPSATVGAITGEMGFVSDEPVQIALDRSIVRGSGDLLVMPESVYTELRWQDGLLAVDGRMLDYGGAVYDDRIAVNLRCELQRVTASALRGFSRLRYDEATEHPVCLAASVVESAFFTEPDAAFFEFDGVNELLETQATRTDAGVWNLWLDYRGIDNAYDTDIQEMIRVRSDGRIARRYDFPTVVRSVLMERSPETSIRWLSPMPPPVPSYRQIPTQYLQRSSSFRRGMDSRTLPPLAEDPFS